ncbi:hypothetical protein N0V90_006449 [Kalmusia sp. IMI 367209]|nr:hypothetical protein N0V90_006449 [Kalmusia sp. IMI 367209]
MATETRSIEKQRVFTDSFQSPSLTSNERIVDRAAERRLVRKLDLRIIPVLWILYLCNFIDRANIGNAKIAGMEKELVLIGQRFNICVWVFNLGYLVAGIPCTILFKKYGPKSLCVMMLLWAVTVIGCGLVRTWQQLVVTRLLEGICESAFISGAAYLIGAYYTTAEYLGRYVVFLTAGIIAGAVNGFISSLIAKMDGVSGYSAWRWIFIIEGLLTIVIALACWFFVPPFPEHCTFLHGEEKELMLARVKEGGHNAHDSITFSDVLKELGDWKIWAGVAMNLGVTENANSLANFQPTILKGLGYTATSAQVHTIPVYLTGAVVSVIFCLLSERLNHRFGFYLLGCAILATGLGIEINYPPSAAVRYAGMFFIACGAYLAMPISIIWVSVNAGSGYKRAIAIAAIINFGTAGAFVSSNVFLFKETPRFHTGFSTGLGLACMGAAAATIYFVGCSWINRKRDAGKVEQPVSEQSFEKLGWEHPDFRFAL